MIYIMLGGPATGKGTRSEILSEKLNIPHISTGEILRDASDKNIELKEKMSKGELISDEIINELLFLRISKTDCKGGFVLDGYPRKIQQVYALEDMLKKLNMNITKVIELIVSEELAFKRILQRKECSICGKAYGIDFPSMNGDNCDDCNGKLVTRSDDTEETLRKRMNTYNMLAKPILDFYKTKNILKTVDSSSHPERVLETLN